jgi:hypothetical protein
MKKMSKAKRNKTSSDKSAKPVPKGAKSKSSYYFGSLNVTSVNSLGIFASSAV